MYKNLKVSVVIPARDEEKSIGLVVEELRALQNRLIDDIVVCDNGSNDLTAQRAKQAGARVVYEKRAGYGIACLTALAALDASDIILFTDGDHSFKAAQAIRLLDGIAEGADLVIGSRVLGQIESGALTAPQAMGNRLAGFLIKCLWGVKVTDLGPYRAIRSSALDRLKMMDTAFGWTVEMQVKAIQQGLRMIEVPVDTKRRIGKSKISGTLRGTIGAGVGILSMIAKLWWQKSNFNEDSELRNKRMNVRSVQDNLFKSLIDCQACQREKS
jgi:glycosyltransferase involved in cell wall biosynthesis